MKFNEINKENIRIIDSTIAHQDISDFINYASSLNVNDSIQTPFRIYDDGYDIGDILFFLYEYVHASNESKDLKSWQLLHHIRCYFMKDIMIRLC